MKATAAAAFSLSLSPAEAGTGGGRSSCRYDERSSPSSLQCHVIVIDGGAWWIKAGALSMLLQRYGSVLRFRVLWSIICLSGRSREKLLQFVMVAAVGLTRIYGGQKAAVQQRTGRWQKLLGFSADLRGMPLAAIAIVSHGTAFTVSSGILLYVVVPTCYYRGPTSSGLARA